jgi:hypothetical protein
METSGTTNAPTYGTIELSFNTDYRVVVAYNFVAGTLDDTASIYVNPINLTTESSNTPYLTDTFWGTATAEPTTVVGVNLRQGTAANAPTLSVDNLAAGTAFGDVAPVPEPSAIALSIVGLCSLIGWLRRSRRA